MQYSGAGGKLIHQKNQMQKISWHCPFNPASRAEVVFLVNSSITSLWSEALLRAGLTKLEENVAKKLFYLTSSTINIKKAFQGA